MQSSQLKAAVAARALWQPDFFSPIKRGPMRPLWRDEDPEEFTRWSRKLQRGARLILRGTGESNGPISRDWRLGFYFRCSNSMHVCALCFDGEPMAGRVSRTRRGAPSPFLLYLYPTSNDPQTLVRWLMADYLASDARQIDEIEERGEFDLTGIIEDWDDS